MAPAKLGRVEAISFALGGIIGGGIFAALGVVATVAGATAWFAYLLAGVVVMATGYSYVRLNALARDAGGAGGAVTFIETFLDRPTLAGMVGWTLLVGYVGTVAMYGYAFGAYFGAIFGLTELPGLGLPARPVLSLAVVAGFVGLNALGVRESGLAEDLLVAVKLGIVVLFSLGGVWYGAAHGQLDAGLLDIVTRPAGPVLAAAVAFVSFEGWQLLFYDQERLEDPRRTLRTAVYVAVPVATLAYVAVAFVTLSLVPGPAVTEHPDLALAIAARQFAGGVGYVLVGVAAVASTASAINATLFSTALFARGMSADGLLPDRLARDEAAGVPTTPLLVIGALTAAFSVYGSLAAITEFASLAFIVVFAAVNALALAERESLATPVPLVGLLGLLAFLPVFVWHLYVEQFDVLVLVAAIAAGLLLLEGLYFEREAVRAGLGDLERRL
ncbi:MAG: APC family permease [Halobacteriales archaeon]